MRWGRIIIELNHKRQKMKRASWKKGVLSGLSEGGDHREDGKNFPQGKLWKILQSSMIFILEIELFI